MTFATGWNRAWVAAACVLAAAGGASAAPKAWVDPTVLDLGVIDEGKLFERYVELKNVGDGTLVLEDLKTSCGCTAAAVDGTVELTAGKSERVRLTFNTKGMEGAVTKKVTIVTNDPETRHLEVTIKADVHRAIRITPKFLELRDVDMKAPWEQLVRIDSDLPVGLEVREAFVLGGKLRNEPSSTFEAAVSPKRTENDADVHEVTVRLRAPAKPQKVSEILVLLTNRPAPEDTMKVAIRGEVVGRLRTTTTFIVLRPVDPGETSRQDVTIRAATGTFKVKSAEVPKSDVTTTVFPSEDGKQAVVTLSYVGKEAGTNGVRNLIVTTDDPDQPRIEIPVRFQTKAAVQAGATPAVPMPSSTAPTSVGPKSGK